MNDINNLKSLFKKYYGSSDKKIFTFFSPGRVNLIGEHIDYNGGYVFPGALTLGITCLIRYRDDNIIRMRSENMENEVEVNLDSPIEYEEKDGWGNYPKGVIKYILDEGYHIKGCDILFKGNLPDGAGLSSSAAIEVAAGYMVLYNILKENIDRVKLSKICQMSENKFNKVNCGIMDQFSVALGRKDSAIFLNCSTLEYKYVPVNLKNYSIVIMNTKKKRGLAGSKYNERRSECDRALSVIRKTHNISNLCNADINDLSALRDEILIKRARHAITENERVKKAVEVLEKGDILEFGKLLTASHMSLKNDYEVTGFELDTIVDEAQRAKGCIGARMTGAGFGGCAIALVKNDCIENFKNVVSFNYTNKTNLIPEFYVSVLGDGVRLIK